MSLFKTKKIFSVIIFILFMSVLVSCKKENIIEYDVPLESMVHEVNEQFNIYEDTEVYLDKNFKYATFSEINDGFAVLTKNNMYKSKNKTVCVNAGHGTINGEMYETYSHPDKSPKLSGGSNSYGSIKSKAITTGAVMKSGELESAVNLKVAKKLKNILLQNGYSVLMIREDENSKLDNIARTVIANNYADIHIAIHFDSTQNDKGIFYITPIRDENYINMEPVKSTYEESDRLGESILAAFREIGEKIFRKGVMQLDLTQISFSTIPNIDIELGDRATDISDENLDIFAYGLYSGVEKFFDE